MSAAPILDQLQSVLALRGSVVERCAGHVINQLMAGEGSITAVLARLFDRTIAIEPNNALRMELARGCPQAETVGVPISEALITSPADFVLCSHVLYYIPQKDWSDRAGPRFVQRISMCCPSAESPRIRTRIQPRDDT